MQITRASDYAVRVMIYLASLPEGSTVRQSQMSRATEVSGHFLSKVLQQLVRARLIRSQRGSGGGYALAAPAGGISLLNVVQVMEGPVRLNQCIEEGPSCERKAWCPAHQVWSEVQTAITNMLGSASIATLASQAKGMSYHLHDETVCITGVTDTLNLKKCRVDL
jgi:Rrf2 family protein